MLTFKKKPRYNVAIMGATGAVGEEMLQILGQRDFPVDRPVLLASHRSVGKKYRFKDREIEVEELKGDSFRGIDLVLASAGSLVSKEFVPYAVSAGAVVIDNTSAYRMDDRVPLVVPEINASDIKKHKGIIANPNCSTIIMLVPIWPIHRVYHIRRVIVSTYQAASGAGTKAMHELETQSLAVLEKRPIQKEVFPHQIAFNLFSHNSAIKDDGYNEEEIKMIRETQKIFNNKKIHVTPTAVRVPIFQAHSEAITLELSKKPNLDHVRKILSTAPGVKVVDDATKNHFPMPLEATGQDNVLVGRIRVDVGNPKGLCLFVSGDQLRKGAALNAVQIAERLCELSGS